jgi:hypothetical protein
VVFLFGPLGHPISVRKRIVTGTITSKDLVGPLQGRSLEELIHEMRSGNASFSV